VIGESTLEEVTSAERSVRDREIGTKLDRLFSTVLL